MKYIAICLATSICLFSSSCAQSSASPLNAFEKLNTTLQKIGNIRYNMNTYIHNPQNNYFYNGDIQTYAEYIPATSLSRVIFASEQNTRIFNGSEMFMLNHSDKSYDIIQTKATVKHLQSASGTYNSLLSLKAALPSVIADETILKQVADTSIENKKYLQLKFSLEGKSISFPEDFNIFKGSTIVQYYSILVDANTMLPYQVIHSNSSSNEYYTRVTFTNIDLTPAIPASTDWYYSSYADYHLAEKKEQQPLIAVGTMMPDWNLPVYQAVNQSIDSLGKESLKGKVTVLEFWIKSCGYCMLAFEDMRKLKDQYSDKNVNILSINVYDPLSDIEFFYNKEKPAYPMLYNGEKLADELGIYGYPKTIILDENGKVIYTASGFNAEKVDQFLKKL